MVALQEQCIRVSQSYEVLKEELENLTSEIRIAVNTETSAQAEKNLQEVLKVQENASRELECIICYEVPLAPAQVFSCREHHLLCRECKSNINIWSCPVCRQNFKRNPPARNRLAEKMILALK